MRAKFVLLLAVLCLLFPLHAPADTNVFPTGPVFKLNSLTWGSGAPQGINQTFFLTPQNVNESVCIYFSNNNPTSSHTFNASVLVTSDPANTSPSGGQWQIAAQLTGLFTPVSPGLQAGIGTFVGGVAQVAISISGSTTQAGSPDTVNVTIIQNPSNGGCFSGGQFAVSNPQYVTAVPALQSISAGISQSFGGSNVIITNPANPQLSGT